MRRNRQYIESALSAVGQHIGTLEVVGGDGGSVSIDKGMSFELPLEEPIRLAEGTYPLVTRPGFFPWEGSVDIAGGRSHQVAVSMLPQRPLPSLSEMALSADSALATADQEPKPGAHRTKRRIGMGVAIGGAVVGAAGIALWATDGAALGNGQQADTKGGPALTVLGIAGLAAGSLLLTGVF